AVLPPARDWARGVDLRAGLARDAQHAERELEWMQPQRVGDAQRAVRLRAADVMGLHAGGAHELRGIFELALEDFRFTPQALGAVRPMRDLEVARAVRVAIDPTVANH